LMKKDVFAGRRFDESETLVGQALDRTFSHVVLLGRACDAARRKIERCAAVLRRGTLLPAVCRIVKESFGELVDRRSILSKSRCAASRSVQTCYGERRGRRTTPRVVVLESAQERKAAFRGDSRFRGSGSRSEEEP
jgi:hypothetical protein